MLSSSSVSAQEAVTINSTHTLDNARRIDLWNYVSCVSLSRLPSSCCLRAPSRQVNQERTHCQWL